MTPESLVRAVRAAAGDPEALWSACANALASDDWQLRKLAVQALGRTSDPGRLLPHLLEALRHSSNTGLRNAAAETLELLGGQVVGSLVAALESESDDDARKFLVDTLGTLRSSAAVPQLARLVADPHPNIRIAAIEALGKLSTPAAAEALLRALDAAHETTERFVALQALTQCVRAVGGQLNLRITALSTLKSEPLLTRPLLQLLAAFATADAERFLWDWLGEFDELRAQEMAKFLGSLEPERLAALTHSYGNPKLKIDSNALRSLFSAIDREITAGAIWLAVWLDATEMLALPFQRGLLPRSHLVAAVAEASASARLDHLLDRRDGYRIEHLETVIEIIGRRGDAARADVVVRLGVQYPELRPLAFRWGAELGCVEVLDWLLELLQVPEQLDLVTEGLRELMRGYAHSVMALLRPWSESIQASEQWRAFLVLVERLNLVALRSRVELAWKRADPALRAAALGVLARFHLEYAQHYLSLALTDESESVRLAASQILADVAGEANIGEVRLLLNDRTPWIRAEALRTLTRLLAERADHDLIRALDDPADIVRIQAIRSLRALNCDHATEFVRNAIRNRGPDVLCEGICFFSAQNTMPQASDVQLLHHAHWRVRLEAVTWLGGFSSFVAEIRRLLANEADGDVTVAAQRVVAQ